MICQNCDEGRVPLGERHITHEMAMDAGNLELEGMFIEIQWGRCNCCYGYWQECENCKQEGVNHAYSLSVC